MINLSDLQYERDVVHHVMIDIETLGTQPGCALVSLGAVAFWGGKIRDELSLEVSLDSCLALGLRVEAGTLAWWMKQSDEARAAVGRGTAKLEHVLTQFSHWYHLMDAQFLWCHGAIFDEPILRACYRTLGREEPWKFYSVKDTRTFFSITGIHPDRDQGTHHVALDDARSQARAVLAGYHKLLGP